MITLSATLLPQAIAPSLQAAALRMTGPEFNAMTEQVQHHLSERNHEELNRILNGHEIHPSREVFQQIITVRHAFAGGISPLSLTNKLDMIEGVFIEDLFNKLNNPNHKLSWPDLRDLVPFGGTRTAQALIDISADHSIFALGIGSALVGIGECAIDACIAALGDQRTIIRRNALNFLCNLIEAEVPFNEPARSRTATFVVRMLEDTDFEIREWAIHALGELAHPMALEPLIRALDDENREVKLAAIATLGDFIDPKGKAVEPLVGLLEDQDLEICREAFHSLAKIGDLRAMEPLCWALGSTEEWVRRTAAEALVRIADPKADRVLFMALSEGREEVSKTVDEALFSKRR